MKRKRRATTGYEKATAHARPALRFESYAKSRLLPNRLKRSPTRASKYKEQGDPSSCGDEVAQALKKAFTTNDGDFDLEAFKRCLKDNDVQAPGVDESKPGWRGRFRMCAGISLRASLRKNGKIVIDGKAIKSDL